MHISISIRDRDYVRVVPTDGGVVLEVTPHILGLNESEGGRIYPPYTPMTIALSASKARELCEALGPQPSDGPQENA